MSICIQFLNEVAALVFVDLISMVYECELDGIPVTMDLDDNGNVIQVNVWVTGIPISELRKFETLAIRECNRGITGDDNIMMRN
jgi:hypothetical protein